MSGRKHYWLSHLAAIEAEGITTKAYAQREGLSVGALYQWRKRLAAGSRPSPARAVGGFVPVRVASRPTEAIGCTVVLEPGLRLECAALPGVDWLAALSVALRARAR